MNCGILEGGYKGSRVAAFSLQFLFFKFWLRTIVICQCFFWTFWILMQIYRKLCDRKILSYLQEFCLLLFVSVNNKCFSLITLKLYIWEIFSSCGVFIVIFLIANSAFCISRCNGNAAIFTTNFEINTKTWSHIRFGVQCSWTSSLDITIQATVAWDSLIAVSSIWNFFNICTQEPISSN